MVGLTPAQLAEHYNNCIKLSAENKISTKNAFNLQLIDYMATMIKRKESDMSNFQVRYLIQNIITHDLVRSRFTRSLYLQNYSILYHYWVKISLKNCDSG